MSEPNATVEELRDEVRRLLYGEPPPEPDVWLEVIAEMEERRRLGLRQYGKPVTPGGDDWLRHALDEALDLAVYLKAEILRRGRAK